MPATAARPGRAEVTSVPGRRSRLIRLAGIALPAARLSTPPLRTVGSHQREQRPASWLELFFDLVFAGAIGQLAGALQDHPALGTLTRFAMLFTPIWWLWVQFTFYADRHESDDAAHRVAFMSAMALCVGLAASGPRALSGHTTAFTVAVILLRGLQLLLYARARRHLPATRALYTRYLIFFGAAGVLWLASLAAGGTARYALWGAALLIDAVGALEMLPPSRPVPVNPWHLADRSSAGVSLLPPPGGPARRTGPPGPGAPARDAARGRRLPPGHGGRAALPPADRGLLPVPAS